MDNDGGGEISSSSKPSDCRASSPFLSFSNGVCSSPTSVSFNKNAAICKGMSDLPYNNIVEPEHTPEVVQKCDSSDAPNGVLRSSPAISAQSGAYPTYANHSLPSGGDISMSSADSDCQSRCSQVPDNLDCDADFLDTGSSDSHSSTVCRVNNEDHHGDVPHQEPTVKMRRAVPGRMLTSQRTCITNTLQNFTAPHNGNTTIDPCEDSHSSLSASNSYTERTQCRVNSVTPTVYNNCNPVDCDSNASMVTDHPSESDHFSRLGYDSVLNTDSVNNSIETLNTSNSSSMNNSSKVITSSYSGSVNTNECDNFMNDRSSQGNVTVCEKSFETNLYQCNNSNDECMKAIVDPDLPNTPTQHMRNGTLERDLSYELSDHLPDQRESEAFKPELPQDAAGEARFKQRRKSRKPLKATVRYVQSFPSHDQSSSPPPSVHSLSATTQLSPPPTLASPPPPPLPPSTPPVTGQPPLSPPLSDVQSSLSSLSPCSSINSDESKCGSARAPLPRLLPIGSAAAAACSVGGNSSSSSDEGSSSSNTNNSVGSAALPSVEADCKRVKIDGFVADSNSNSETQPSSSSPCGVADILPPPPPYPKENNCNLNDVEKAFQISNKEELSTSNDEDASGEGRRSVHEKSTDSYCNGVLKLPLEKRPPPPPYHSHFFVKKTDTDSALDSNVNVSKKASEEDNQPASSRSDSPGSLPSLGESFWSSVHLPSTLSVSPVPSELEKQRAWTDHSADRSETSLTDDKSNGKSKKNSNPSHRDSKLKQVKGSSSGVFNRSFDSSDGSDAGSVAAKSCLSNSKLSATSNGSNLSYYSTATVAMLLQQLAAAQQQGASGNSNGGDLKSDRNVASDSREGHSGSSRLREEQYLKQPSKEDRLERSTATSRNHQVGDGDGPSRQSQKGDKKTSSNTININIDKSNLSSILNNLIAKTSIVPDSTTSGLSSNNRFSDPIPSHLALKSLLPASSSVSISSALLTPSSSANSGPLSPTSSAAPTSSTSSYFQSSSDLLSHLSRQSLLPAVSSGSLKLPSLSSSAQQLALQGLTSTSPTLSPTLSESNNNDNRLQSSSTPCLDLSSKQPHSGSSSPQNAGESQHQQQSHVTAALLAAAALQNSYGGGMPSMMMDSPLSRLLMGNSSSPECSSYSALTGSTDLGYPGLSVGGSSGYGGVGLSPTETTGAKADSNSDHPDASSYQKLVQDCGGGMNSLNNIATLSYLLQQQQQMESLGLGGGGGTGVGGGNNAASLNGLAALSTLNSLAGLSSLPPGMMPDGSLPMPLHQVLKKMRYSDGSGGASTTTKRKPRSSNHTKSFHCSLCSKRFSLKDELEEHMLTHTSDELGNESYMQKSFACSECSFRTKYKFCLQRHMHIHSGEKPLVCPYCRYRSISKVSYDNHIRTHTGEKPFACPYCSYKSSFKNNLTKHIKTHTGSSKPYTCNKCSSCFTSQMQLKSHMRLHLDPTGTHNCTQCLYTCMSRFELECHMRTHIPV